MNKNIIIVVVLAVIIVLVGILFFLPNNWQPGGTVPQGNEGIEITTPLLNSVVAAPLKITGKVKGNGWTGFEGQVGTVKLFDSADKELAVGILTATADWMQLPTPFATTLYFDYLGEGSGKLVFYNENASGEPERDKTFTLPVKLTKSSSQTMRVAVYFNNGEMDPAFTCEKVFSIEREIPKVQAVARAALEVLLLGLTNLEKDVGYSTAIPQGVKIQNLVIENGVAKVDFNQALQQGVAGSCRMQAIRAQITQTLKQFSTVTSVEISIDGKTEGILQP